MKLLDGIFYQYYWARFPRGFDNRLYQSPISIACVMSTLLSSASLPLIVFIMSLYDIEYNLKWLFVIYYVAMAVCSLVYFFIKKRYKQIVSNEEYNRRDYRIAAILYPILCIVCMFGCFMMMCLRNQIIHTTPA